MESWPLAETHELVATPTAPRWGRKLVEQVLTRWRMQELSDTTTLLVSELVTNAVDACERLQRNTHGLRPVKIRVRSNYRLLLVEVWDPSGDPPRARKAGPSDEDGRGLLLVSELSKQWDFYYPLQGGGKVVWFVVELPDHRSETSEPNSVIF